jgi:hypothetical protein
MNIAIMQPYIFPYIGYFQLIAAVEKFIFYDDVNFIKQGWINRNKILVNEEELLFTMPIEKISSYIHINQVKLSPTQYIIWKKKFLTTLIYAYKKAPNFDKIYKIVDGILNIPPDYNMASICKKSIMDICSYIGLERQFVLSSAIYENDSLKSADRIIDICNKEMADIYTNMVGGEGLYDVNRFKENGIKLKFLKADLNPYNQYLHSFTPSLSIIDILMFNDKLEVKNMFSKNSFI